MKYWRISPERVEGILNERTKGLDEKITSLRNETIVRFDSIEKRMSLMEKIMELEARLARVEARG